MICYDRVSTKFEEDFTDGSFVIFLTGVRINEPLKIHKWLPVIAAMPGMISELRRQPDLGLMHAEAWFSRTTIMVQYWRSMELLLAYARNRGATHLPAWYAFNEAIGTTGAVGVWHETYIVAQNSYANEYIDMPPFGLAQVKSTITSSLTDSES